MIKAITQSAVPLEKALDIRSSRHTVITSNISNQDTPGYKSKEIDFKKAMADAGKTAPVVKMAKTDAGHLSTGPSSGIQPEVTLSASTGSKRLDGNTVNPEKEMARLAENTFMYQATAQLIARKFSGLKNVINEGRR
ncbi:MAG: flagellar basal body rod protein FlgB [Nitrospiria bacterium]